jgi:hypothetical protein
VTKLWPTPPFPSHNPKVDRTGSRSEPRVVAARSRISQPPHPSSHVADIDRLVSKPDIPTPAILEPLFHISQLDSLLRASPTLLHRPDHERHRLQRRHRPEDVVPCALQWKPPAFLEGEGKMLDACNSPYVMPQCMKFVWNSIEGTEKDRVKFGVEVQERVRSLLLSASPIVCSNTAVSFSNCVLDFNGLWELT